MAMYKEMMKLEAASAAAMSSGFGGFESFLCLDVDAAFHGVE